jgi:hypothetical protein
MGMRRLVGQIWWLVLGLGLLAACNGASPTAPTAVGENGIPVAPELAGFYQAHGGPRALGQPISELFVAEENGRALQYFQTVRLEYDSATGQVYVTPLGEWAMGGLREQIPASVPENGATRAFASADFVVQDEFLAFYERYQGETLLGEPISPQLNVDELRVQYFENGRLEWRPEAPTDWRVQLSYLGQAHFDNEMRFTYQENRNARPVSSAGVSAVRIDAYVKAPILYNGEDQVVYVTVQTPGGDPVTGTAVDLTIAYNGVSTTITLGLTDDQGQIVYPLTVNAPPGEQVVLTLQARDGNGRYLGETVTTFKTWW